MSREEILMLLKKCIFDGELAENNYHSKIMNFLPKNVEVETGATKLVLFFPNTDFVIKIPFNGYLHIQYGYNDETEEYEEIGEDFFPFEYAQTIHEEDYWNYCQVEVELYKEAIVEQIEQFFLETELFTIINNIPIYIQQKADIFTECGNKYDEDTIKKTKEKCNEKDLCCFNAKWLSDVFDYYKNDDKVFDLLVFAENYLDDLHSGNLGYVHGKPVIIDYAGYNEDN